MDLHPYDNVERRYRHTDETWGEGRKVVAHVLGLSKPPAGEVLFDMSFFSGGIGVLDRLAITLPADPALWPSVVKSLRCPSPEEGSADESWLEQLIWLFTSKQDSVPIRPAADQFINRERQVELPRVGSGLECAS